MESRTAGTRMKEEVFLKRSWIVDVLKVVSENFLRDCM